MDIRQLGQGEPLDSNTENTPESLETPWDETLQPEMEKQETDPAEESESSQPETASVPVDSKKADRIKKLREQHNEKVKPKGRRLSVKGLVILLSAASITAAWLMNSSWSVRTIEVEGNHFTTADDIIKAANMAPGTKPDSLQALKVILRIEKLPYIAEARIEPNPPGAVKIVVVERKPIGIVSDGNRHVVLDNKGVKMPIVRGKVPDLPLVYGFSTSFRDTLKGKPFEAVSAFLNAVISDELAMAAIGEIGYDNTRGVVAISQRNNVKLYFGHDQFETRLKSLQAFYAQIVRSRGLESFEWIDFRFEHQVVTKELS